MRVYVPASLATLASYVEAGAVPAGADRFAATAADEESEYLALMSAADAASELGAARRVVVVAELDDLDDVDAELPRATWVAVHADTHEAADPDDEPAWYAVQEIPALLG